MLIQRDKLIEDEMERNGYYEVDPGPEKTAIRMGAGKKIENEYKHLWKAEEFIEEAKKKIEDEKRKFEMMGIFNTNAN